MIAKIILIYFPVEEKGKHIHSNSKGLRVCCYVQLKVIIVLRGGTVV